MQKKKKLWGIWKKKLKVLFHKRGEQYFTWYLWQKDIWVWVIDQKRWRWRDWKEDRGKVWQEQVKIIKPTTNPAFKVQSKHYNETIKERKCKNKQTNKNKIHDHKINGYMPYMKKLKWGFLFPLRGIKCVLNVSCVFGAANAATLYTQRFKAGT